MSLGLVGWSNCLVVERAMAILDWSFPRYCKEWLSVAVVGSMIELPVMPVVVSIVIGGLPTMVDFVFSNLISIQVQANASSMVV